MKKKIIGFLVLINLIIVFRVCYLNINNNYQIQDKIIYGLTAPRGRILDVNGNILVDNIGVKSLIFNKLNIKNSTIISIAQALADILELTPNIDEYNLRYYYYQLNKEKVDNLVSMETLKKYEERAITSNDLLNNKLSLITDEMLEEIDEKEAYIYYLLNKGYSYEDKIIKTNITDEEYIKINELNLSGLRTDITWERYYPYGDMLRDVFGNVSSFSQGIPSELKSYYLKKGYELNDRVGINNLEYIYDDYLKGEKAVYKVVDNHLVKISDAVKGKDLVLSIDINLQQDIEDIMEEEMIKAKKEYNTKYYNSSFLVVSNPSTGEIISLIGKKIDDDNNFMDYSYYNAISSYTVGSVVKGASISVGYQYNIIDETTKVKDSCVVLKSQKPKCSWKTLGTLNDIEALRMSSNYFQYLIAIGITGNIYKSGIKLNASSEHFQIYRDMFALYGLGVKTGIDLSNETTGIKGSTISDDLLLNMSIGQYDTYSTLNLTQYINTIATSNRTSLSLLKYVLNNDGSIYYENKNEVLNSSPIDEEYLNRIREGFKAVNESGTGYSYTNHTFTSAGKTGTAETYIDTDLDGKVDQATINTSYVMYAPFDNPKFSIVIVSPNIKYQNNVSSYKYPLNAKIVKRVSELVYDTLK
jgi:cell division protein FtsI/penicillin-binding protein 2